jgi:hypothetical protein
MHLIENQYLKKRITLSKDIYMHDLYSIYRKVHKTLRSHLKQYLVIGDNVKHYPNKPKMTDLEIISLAITSECLGIDSENLLFSKINKDYSHYIIDSIPIAVCKICREKRSTVCRKEHDIVQATKGYDSTIRQYYIGYKLHLIVSSSGVYQHHELLPAHMHDLTPLKKLEYTHLSDCVLIGDKAYRSNPLQLKLFEHFSIELSSPYRENQKDYKKYPYERKIVRKRIETCFSQYCDDFNLKRNYAKSFAGMNTRVSNKIAAMTFKQYWNYLHGNKVSRTKHSLAA